MNVFLAGIGSLLQLKPILTMKYGQPASEKVRTAEKATQHLVDMMHAYVPIEKFALLHTHAPEKAEKLRARIENLLPERNPISMDITPVLGAHLGPDAVGYALVSKKEII